MYPVLKKAKPCTCCQKGHLHGKCDRITKLITEFHLSEAEPAEKRISKRYGPVKSPVSGRFRGCEKWTTAIRNWAQICGELSIVYEGRLPE